MKRMMPARRRRQQRFALLLGLLLGLLAALTEAWQLPFAHQRRQQHARLQRAIGAIGPLSAAQTTRPADSPTTTTTTASSGGSGGDGDNETKGKEDEGPMDAYSQKHTNADGEQGKLLEVLRGLIMRPIEGEWEAWAAQEREVARALKAGLQSEGQEGEDKEEGEEPASVVSMKVLSTLAEELTPEVRGVLEQAIEKIKAQEAEAREKVTAELSDLKAQQRQYIAEREEELEVVEGYADQIKELTRAVTRKETEVQQLRRNLKEIQNIQRDLAYRLEQGQRLAEGAKAQSEATIEELQRQLGQEQAALKELQTREAAITKERDQARAQTTALIAAMATETGGRAAEGTKALEQRLNEFVDAVGIREEYEREVVGRTVVGEEGTDAWAAWYDQAFKEVEGRVEAVGAAAEAAVNGMKGEVQGMKGEVEGLRREVEAAEQRVLAARAEAEGAVKQREEWRKKASTADAEREAVEENARLLQSLYDEETARFEAAMYKMMRRLKEGEAQTGKVQEAARIEKEQLERGYDARLQEKERALAAAEEGKEVLARQLEEEAKSKAEALAAKDAQLQEEAQSKDQAVAALNTQLKAEVRAREGVEGQLASIERKVVELQASVERLGQERQDTERRYEAMLASERNVRMQDRVEWQRRVDKVRTEEMAAIADMQAAQDDARRIAQELEGTQASLSTYEKERGSVRSILRLLARVVVEKVVRRRRQRRQGQQGVIAAASAPAGAVAENAEYEAAAHEKARLYAQRTVQREHGRWEELERLIPKQQQGHQEGELD